MDATVVVGIMISLLVVFISAQPWMVALIAGMSPFILLGYYTLREPGVLRDYDEDDDDDTDDEDTDDDDPLTDLVNQISEHRS